MKYEAARERQPRPGVPDEAPLNQTLQDVRLLQTAFQRVRQDGLKSIVAYLLGLIAGGGRTFDVNARTVIVQLRRGLINRGSPNEGMIVFEGVSERSFSQRDCIRRDAERIVTRLDNAFTKLATNDVVDLEQSSDFVFRIACQFTEDSVIWPAVSQHFEVRGSTTGRYVWPDRLDLGDAGVRPAFLEGYMDLRTRITATDALPPPTPFMRIAVSVGRDPPEEFAEDVRDLIAAEFECDPDQINLLLGPPRGRESIIRIDARLVPTNFLQSHWQRIVLEDFRRFNDRITS